jgi:heat shock protein HtpX
MYSEIDANKRKTVFIMAGFFGLVAGFSYLFASYIGDASIAPFVILGAGAYSLFTYYAGSRMALAMNGAKPIQKKDNPRLWRIVENLAITNGMPMPKVYMINDPAPNAFATGRNPEHAVVGVTTGLLDIMTDSELEGVMAHELGHVKNYDIRVSLIAFALVAAVGILADIMIRIRFFGGGDDDDSPLFIVLGLLAALIAPVIAAMIQMAISRKREYLADATGSLTTRHPEALASALEKIGAHGRPMKRQNPSSAHLFFSNPLKKGSFMTLFSTHPPLKDRVAKLRSMGTHG